MHYRMREDFSRCVIATLEPVEDDGLSTVHSTKHARESCMRFGLLLTNQHPPGTAVAERFAETIAQVRLARELGFD